MFFLKIKQARAAQKEAEKREAEQHQRILAENAAQRAADFAELVERLKKSSLMDALMLQLECDPWVFTRQGLDDDGFRHVSFSVDGFSITQSRMCPKESTRIGKYGIVHYETTWEKEIVNQVAYSYIKSGYAPLSSYKSLSVNDVLFCWQEEWKNRMKKRVSGINVSGFERYILPMPTEQAF